MKENVEYLRKIVHVHLAGRCQFIATRSLPCLVCLITCKSYSVSKEGDDEDDQEQGHDGDDDATHGAPDQLDAEVDSVKLPGEDSDPGREDGSS